MIYIIEPPGALELAEWFLRALPHQIWNRLSSTHWEQSRFSFPGGEPAGGRRLHAQREEAYIQESWMGEKRRVAVEGV